MTSLIVSLPLRPTPQTPLSGVPFAYVLTADGRTVASQSPVLQAVPALLPAATHGEVVAVVPVQALSWHEVQLPRGTLARGFLSDTGAPRLRAVLEGLLEERLLDDPAALHFALGPDARDDAPVWVAVCDRAWLREAVQVLEQVGRPVARIVPEFAPTSAAGRSGLAVIAGESSQATPVLPTEKSSKSTSSDIEPVGADEAPALWVTGSPQQPCLVVAKRGLSVLPLTPATVALTAWPEAAPLLAEPAVAALAETLFQRRVELLQTGPRWLLASQSAWDLAQFDLVNSSRTRTWKRFSRVFDGLWRAPRWRAARWSALALVGVNLLGLNAWAWAERNRMDAKKQAIREVLTGTFPGVKVVVDAPLQMTRALADLRRETGSVSQTDFESIFSSFGSVVPVNQAQFAIEYIAGELRIKGQLVQSAELNDWLAQLKRRGWAAQRDGDALVVRAEAAP